MYNRTEIIGYLGADPETRYTSAGAAITSLRVATSERWKDKQTGEQQERTEWHSVTAFNRLGEICGEYLKKGSLVLIVGRLRTEEYEKDGIKRYSTKIIADEMKMLGGRGDNGGDGTQRERAPKRGPQSAPAQRGNAPAPQGDGFDDDDIPF